MLYPMTPKVVELKLWLESLWTNTMFRRVRARVAFGKPISEQTVTQERTWRDV
jgi:hypothetical protein